MALVATPPVATRMGCSSPFVFDFTLQMVEGMLKSRKGDRLTVYLDWGRYDVRNPDEAWDMAEMSNRLSVALEDAGHRVYGGQVNTGSDWPSWKNRTDALLKALFPRA